MSCNWISEHIIRSYTCCIILLEYFKHGLRLTAPMMQVWIHKVIHYFNYCFMILVTFGRSTARTGSETSRQTQLAVTTSEVCSMFASLWPRPRLPWATSFFLIPYSSSLQACGSVEVLSALRAHDSAMTIPPFKKKIHRQDTVARCQCRSAMGDTWSLLSVAW